MATFRHSYRGLDWREFLHPEEERERHLLHQVGHIWLAESLGATLTALKLDQDGVSDVTLNGRLTPQQHYQVGVAGLLAEAKGIAAHARREPHLDVDRMTLLAGRIVAEVSARRSDRNNCFLVEVPLSTRIPSRETAGCAVGDFIEANSSDLDPALLLPSLRQVAAVFNAPRRWAEYLSLVKELRP